MGSCLTLGNELSEERSAIQVRAFIGKGCWGGGQEGEVNGENCSATWLTVSGNGSMAVWLPIRADRDRSGLAGQADVSRTAYH